MDTETTFVSKADFAWEAGVTESKVSKVAVELDYLRQNGLLVDLRISGTGMFTRSASMAEIGIADDDIKNARYTPGSKYLIPKSKIDQLRSVEVRMRQMLDKYGQQVTGFKPYRWLPWTAYRAFKARWEELQSEFKSIKASILANMDGYRDLLADEFAQGARRTWQAIEGQGYSAIIFGGRGYLGKESFIDAVVQQALSQMPSEAKIGADLHADYTVGMLWTEFDKAAAQAQVDASQEVAKSKAAAAKALEHEAYLKDRAAQEAFNYQWSMQQLEKQKKELEIEAMLAAEMAHAKEQIASLASPFEEVFGAMRAQIASDCEMMLESIKTNGFVRGKIAEKGRSLLELFDLMAAHNDQELRGKLLKLREQIGNVGSERAKSEPERNPETIAQTLQEIIELAHIEAQELAEVSRAAFLEI